MKKLIEGHLPIASRNLNFKLDHGWTIVDGTYKVHNMEKTIGYNPPHLWLTCLIEKNDEIVKEDEETKDVPVDG